MLSGFLFFFFFAGDLSGGVLRRKPEEGTMRASEKESVETLFLKEVVKK